MSNTLKLKNKQRLRRKKHVRKRVFGSPERPRLCVHRTLKHISAQVVDDTRGVTLLSCGTEAPELREQLTSGATVAAAAAVGTRLAEIAAEKGITTVCFDRSSFKYHGRVRALAEAARKGGLIF